MMCFKTSLRRLVLGAVMLAAVASSFGSPLAASLAPIKRPNIVLIVADDLGFTDVGAFGGEIRTPNIDRLASEGLRLVNFHATPLCQTTRAALLSGTDHHIAGVGAMYLNDKVRGKTGYEGHLHARVHTLPELMRAAGYRTYMTGKWHLGSEADQGPRSRGFDESFVLLDGSGSHLDKTGSSKRTAEARYRDGLDEIRALPQDFYSTRYFTETMIGYIRAGQDTGRPFFAYLALTAPHWPLQVPDEYLESYRGVYDEGYDVLRGRRVRAAVGKGVLPATALEATTGAPIVSERWTDLTDPERRESARRMEVYAAMVEYMDAEVGRLINYLEASRQLQNTVIIFISDNGAEGYQREVHANQAAYVAEMDNSLGNIGRRGSFVSYGPGWAGAGSAIFRLHKGFLTEGGNRVAAIIWDGRARRHRGTSGQFLTVSDIMPTSLDLAGALPMFGRLRDGSVLPLSGSSFLPLLSNSAAIVRPAGAMTVFELHGHRAVYQDRWKLLWLSAEQSGSFPGYQPENRWALFDLDRDPGESEDLASREPQQVARMTEAWDQFVGITGLVVQ